MKISARLLAAFVLALVPATAQEDRQPYFSLSSNRTFAPGDKPVIQMWSQNVSSLEFRVYKVKDPVLFFQKLEDVHRFGAGAARARTKRELTLVERFHSAKVRLRDRVRNSFRAQYTKTSREYIRDWIAGRNREPVSKVSSYPQIPL